MPRPRPRLRISRPEARPFTETDGRITQHVTGHDYFSDGYGEGENFDREQMQEDWETRRDEIVELARLAYPLKTTLWSEKEFGG